MIRINLVPREILDKEIYRQRVLQATVGASVFGVLLVGLSLSHIYRANRLEKHLVGLQREYDKLAKVVAQVEELERTAGAVRNRLNVITGLLKGRPLYPYFMTDLVGTLPAGVWLTQLSTVTRDSNSLGITTTATANSSDGVSQWLRNLERSGRFEEPKLSGGITIVDRGDIKEHSFSLTMNYRHPDL